MDLSYHVLVADDEPSLQKLYASVLAAELPGCVVCVAADGGEAESLYKRHHPLVIVMDLRMPVQDGITAYEHIQAYCEKQNRPIPAVVFCTGFAPPDAVHRIVAAHGRHALLTKPVEMDELVTLVRAGLPFASGNEEGA